MCWFGESALPGVAALLAPFPLAAGRGSLARGLEGRAPEPEEDCGAADSPEPFPVGLGIRGEALPDFCPDVGLALAVDCAFADDEPAVPCWLALEAPPD